MASTVVSNILSPNPGSLLPAVPFTIASGQATSSTVNANGYTLVGIMFPAAFTGTVITFLVSVDGVTFRTMIDAAGPVSYTVAQARYIGINPVDFYGVQYFQIVSNASEGALRNLTCSLKGL